MSAAAGDPRLALVGARSDPTSALQPPKRRGRTTGLAEDEGWRAPKVPGEHSEGP